jgi:hypothetical protein
VTDPLLRMLEGLPQAAPDRARAARVRARCHAALARGRRPRRPRRFTESLLAGLGAVYLIDTIREVLLLLGIV